MGTLQDKVAIVTGSSHGIGYGIAKSLSARGAKVVISCRHEDEGIESAKTLGLDEGRAAFVKCDVSDLDQLQNLVKETVDTFGKIDILVNNAGYVESSTIRDVTVEIWDRQFNTNVRSMVFLTQYALPYLLETKGCIVNMSSFGWMAGVPGQIAYEIGKGTIAAFTKCLSAELAPEGVRVNTITPGIIETPDFVRWIERMGGKAVEGEYLKTIPLGRWGTIDEMGECVALMCENEYMTGTNIVCDGGIMKY